MKKLYRKGSVHPSPPLKPDHLSFLPAAVFTLAVALSPQDREVLAYLISSSSSSSNFSGDDRRRNTSGAGNTSSCNSNNGISSGVDHPPSFNCYCFRCYMSYWARWDSSPNRQLIHEIIDAYEDGLSSKSKKEKSRKDRRKNGKAAEPKRSEPAPPSNKEVAESSGNCPEDEMADAKGSGEGDDGGEQREEEEVAKGSVRRFVSFVGEKIWGVWT